VHVGAWQVLTAVVVIIPPTAGAVWQVSGVVQSVSAVHTSVPPFGQPPVIVAVAQVAAPNPSQQIPGEVQSVVAVQALAPHVITPLPPAAAALQLSLVPQSESEAQTDASPFGHPPAMAGVRHVAVPPPAQQTIGEVQLVVVQGGGRHCPFAPHVPPFLHSVLPAPLQSCVAPVGHVASHTLFVAAPPNPPMPPPASLAATGSLQQTCDPHWAALVHWVTVPEQDAALATHAYVGAAMAAAVRQQNCEGMHDVVVEFGGHAMVSLTTIPASFKVPVPLAPVEPVAVPVDAPVPAPAAPVEVPEVVPDVPELVPVEPEEPLLVEPPQATPTATTTTEVIRIVRTGFKTRHLRHS
jgi:hypothetical protein